MKDRFERVHYLEKMDKCSCGSEIKVVNAVTGVERCKWCGKIIS